MRHDLKVRDTVTAGEGWARPHPSARRPATRRAFAITRPVAVLVPGFCCCLLLGALFSIFLGSERFSLVLFFGLFLMDDIREQLFHFLGDASG